jgi:eukaryotic-like serine/threonine-protein kinase
MYANGRMIGRRIAHFEIIGKLGEGGMGVVYEALDSHLDRYLALKILPPDKVANSARKQRFVQEAKAASALYHPNIVTIYDIGEADGFDYIAMELVPGKTLEDVIGRHRLKITEVLKYAVQIAGALAAAHAAVSCTVISNQLTSWSRALVGSRSWTSA